MRTFAWLMGKLSPSAVGLGLLVLAGSAAAQVFVYPRRAEQSQVRYFDFDWETRDLVIPIDGAKDKGRVRLYFYARERAIAERAGAVLTEEYAKLAARFQYVPSKSFPYVLYSSYQEFLQTNLFPVQEGVLGVTSPVDLVLTLPYLGDDRLFKQVSAHEMTHQFTIQKLRDVTRNAKASGDPLEGFPLWFIEGLAEFYAKGGMDPEAELAVRDLVVNPAPEKGYALIDFFEDRPRSVLWTYKAGQVRCAFLEAEYGEGFLQKLLDASVKFVLPKDNGGLRGFDALLKKLTGDDKQTVSRKFESWLKRRSFGSYLAAKQDPVRLKPLSEVDDESSFWGVLTALSSSPDGDTLAVRTLDPDTFQSRLQVTDRRDPTRVETVASDGVPGVESLHPVAGRNFALSNDQVAYFAESRARDVLYVQRYRTVEGEVTRFDGGIPDSKQAFRVSLGASRELDLGAHGLLAAYSPAFSPDGRRLAFVAMNEAGQRDLYVLDLEGDGRPIRLTDDFFSEREVSWGPDGIVYTSDATSHGYYNLFRVAPDGSRPPSRLTTEERDALSPVALADGRVLYTGYASGRANLYEVDGQQVVLRTDVATGLFDASPGPSGGVWALLHRRGELGVVRLSKADFQSDDPDVQPPATDVPALTRMALSGSQPYHPFDLGNWELGPIFGIIGGGTGGIAGELLGVTRDRLGNHALVLNVAVYGSFALTDGFLLYINQEQRITWGFGPFQALRFRSDETFPALPLVFASGERFLGGMGSFRYPLSRFNYTQLDLAVGSASYFLLPGEQALLADPALNGLDRDLFGPWLAENSGSHFQTEATLRWGYDTLRFGGYAGPVSGSSLLFETIAAVQPVSGDAYGNLRLDGAQYFSLGGTASLGVRGAAGTTMGGRLARQFFLSSFDSLRGVQFGDVHRLLGRDFGFATAELRLPLGELIRVAFLNPLQGVVGVDAGGVGDGWQAAIDRRVVDVAAGINLGLGPFVFKLHFAKNIPVGAPAGLPVANNAWVTNLSLRFLGAGDYLGARAPRLP